MKKSRLLGAVCANTLLLISVVVIFASNAYAATFMVSGSGIVFDQGGDQLIGVGGETVTFSFIYDTTEFGDKEDQIPGNPAHQTYTSLISIPVALTGSSSGLLTVDDISLVQVSDFTLDQLNFRSGVSGLVQANNLDGSAFSSPFPTTFTDTNAIFYDQLQNTSLWEWSTNISFGLDYLDSGHTLQIVSGSVVISQVPIPAAFWFFGSGLLGLIGMARRKKAA